MGLRVYQKGHLFEKTSDCAVCPKCSSDEMKQKYGKEFPNINVPAFHALHSAGVVKLSDLTKYTEEELLTLHGFGPSALRILTETLEERGLSLKY